ncbi:hypothetical protein TSOC_001836 [Tetrabaena socialis]|uniref:Uncharacterized protein n=1 Tax=Tetrabaena socialis TaxID=47790 RepID=A0A2J8AFQ4_9CHLO|nr:hypothetical protein TSOC_001836 [Tetrabaena socialis]|eukprot:PNH11336.1 hypothetical protein TSOC_001836 [Tetrabaena socialis]
MGAGLGSGPLGANSLFGSMELPPSASQSLQQQQASPAGTAAEDYDDAESVRMSVMSHRSFYSARSHVEHSSSSGLTSPNEAPEQARRWLMQRELHAAAIASALAATAAQHAATPVSSSGPSCPRVGR